MKVFISIDLEGITGVCAEAQTDPGMPQYATACELMRADLDAALEGCLSAGATEIVVCDAHYLGTNLTCQGLPPQVSLASGWPAALGMMHGLDDTFTAAVFIGYHAMAGTRTGVLDHTFTYDVYRVRIGEHLEVGETGVNAGLAGHYGVPVVFASGDAAIAQEARELLPDVRTAVVKYGTSRTAARLLPPELTRPLIRDGVAEALLAANRPDATRLRRSARDPFFDQHAPLRCGGPLSGRRAGRRTHAEDRRRGLPADLRSSGDVHRTGGDGTRMTGAASVARE